MEVCPICGGILKLKNGRYGEFYGCSNYPECHYTISKDILEKSRKYIDINGINVNDIVKLKNLKTNEVHTYKIIRDYKEYKSVFVGFSNFGPVYNNIPKIVEGGNPDDPINPTINAESAVGELLLGKKVGDIITYKNDTYEIIEFIKSETILIT